MLLTRYINVQQGVAYLEEVLGVAWLKENLKLLKSSAGGGVAFGRGIDPATCGVTALAYHWYRAREELVLAELGGGEPGLSALAAAVVGDDLLALRGSAGLDARVEGLKQVDGHQDRLDELAIAAGYARRGAQVAFARPAGCFRVVEPPLGVQVAGVSGCCGAGAPLSVLYRPARQTIGNTVSGPGEDDGGVPVVEYRFTAGTDRRGPFVSRAAALAGDQGCCSGVIYLPREIIMPVGR